MEAIKNLNLKIKEFFSKKQSKKATFILLLGCIGVLIFCISDFIPDESKSPDSVSA